MVVKEDVKPYIIRYKGIFDWNSLYSLIVSFLPARKYDFFEKGYEYKKRGNAMELEGEWMASREQNEYFLNQFKIYIKINDFQYVDITDEKGNKKQMVRGRLYFELTPSVHLDYDDKWESSPFKKKLEDFYHKFVIRKEIEEVWVERIKHEAWAFSEEVKKLLKFESVSKGYRWKLH